MNELQEALDRIFNNCEEIDNHNPIEEQTGYKMLEDIKLLGKGVNDLQQRIDKAIEYIENHSLYEEEYDYDYEETSYLSGIDDEQAKRDLLEILKGDKDEHI